MKWGSRIGCSAILAGFCMVQSASAGESTAVPIGTKIANLKFKDLRYLARTLDDFPGKKAYAIVFVNSSCPLVQRYLPRMKQLDEKYGPEGVQVIGINVGAEDTIRDMASHALEVGILFPFVKDFTGATADALGVERTPEAVVLDAGRVLRYRGRIDSQYRVGGPRPDPGRSDLEEAIQEVLAGKTVSVAETPCDGCLITKAVIPAPKQAVTFSEHIAPLMQKYCQDCHHEGTAAPFGLVSYEEVAAHGQTLAEVALEQRMPPWYASPKYGHFKNDPSLSREERTMVAQWVRAGMPEGDPSKAPKPRQFADTRWRIGKPDLVITMTQTHEIPADGYVPYKYVVLPYIFFNETWIEAFEILPDNAKVVHHCNMAYGSPTSKTGYETFITGYVPGGQPMDLGHFPGGVAYRIPANSILGLQIHYTTCGTPQKSKISVGIRYPRGIVHKRLEHVICDTHKFLIPPGHPAHPIADAREIKDDVSLLGMFSHMHVRGKDMTFLAHYPNGKTETLLQIPNYNFEWQLGYEIEPGTKHLPKGTKLEAVAHYDNSTFNPYNPDPKRAVPYGQQTYDEMLNGFAFFVKDNEDLNLKIDPKTGRVVK